VGSEISILSAKRTDFVPLGSRNLLNQIKENSVADCDFRTVGHCYLGATLCLRPAPGGLATPPPARHTLNLI
jgi:hypothetical protein